MLEIIAFIAIGAGLGVITGLVPGLHVNNLVVLVLAFSGALLEQFSVHEIAAFIIAMSVVHSFVSFVPSMLLGAPEEDTALSVAPGHRMLLAGRAYEAIRLTVLGGVGATLLGCAILPLGVHAFPAIYSSSREIIPFLLLVVLAYMVLEESTRKKKTAALIVVLLSAALGYVVLNSSLLPSKYALFPMLAGFFGIATLLTSFGMQTKIPKQEMSYSNNNYSAGIALGSVGGIAAGLLPGVGSSQVALIMQRLARKQDEKEFLVVLGGLNTSDAIYALFALYLIGNPRSGASIAVQRIMGEFSPSDFLFMVSVVLAVTFFAAYATLGIARIFIAKVQGIDYGKFSLAILIFLVALILVLTGFTGLLVAATATTIGLFAAFSQVKRSHCMASLIVPTILYFL